jgi:hypothetical protein
MKQFKSIILLAGFACAITVFWLAPGINKANSDYVRVYEDTYTKPVAADKETPTNTLANQPQKPPMIEKTTEKKYLKQKIKGDAKLEELELEMFSRAIQFEEEVIVPLADEVDSSLNVVTDSIELAVSDPQEATY